MPEETTQPVDGEETPANEDTTEEVAEDESDEEDKDTPPADEVE